MEEARSAPVGRFPPAKAAVLGVALAAMASAAIIPFRSDVSRAIPALVLVVPIVVAGLAGGRWPALITALMSAAAFDLGFIPPHGTPKIHALEDVVALAVFAIVAGAVGTLVAREGDRRKAAEERANELVRVNTELIAVQEERGRLAEEATQADVLKRVDEQRAALLRSVSHDLRTPLSSIRAVASDLLSDAHYEPETRRELLVLVADEAERLDRLVANLLSLSRIEAGALRPDRNAVALDELVSHVVKRLERLLRGVRVQVEMLRDLPPAQGDHTLLDQVVSNLLENAARHTSPGSTIRIGARSRNGSIDVWVDDEGPGVAGFDQRRIFEPFRRGQGLGAPPGGIPGSATSGIGLAICKAIVEAHGGTISVMGAPGGGARFAFTVPAHHG